MRIARSDYSRALRMAVVISLVVASASLSSPSPASASDGCYPYWGVGQQDNYYTASDGTRLHGWLIYNRCLTWGLNQFRYSYGQDSRYCDGCSFKDIPYHYIHGRAWMCGTKFFDSSSAEYNWHYAYLGYTRWSDHAICGKQADVYGQFQRSGYWYHDYYLNW